MAANEGVWLIVSVGVTSCCWMMRYLERAVAAKDEVAERVWLIVSVGGAWPQESLAVGELHWVVGVIQVAVVVGPLVVGVV